MTNIIDILKGIGIEIPADKLDAFNASVAENYKTSAEFSKKVNRLEAERDSYKDRAENAENTLKGFEGVDLDSINRQLADYKTRAENAEKDYAAKLGERDFNDALKVALDEVSFSSSAARKAIEADIRAAGLKLSNGKILGLGDLIEQKKAEDASAFVDKGGEASKARFTQKIGGNTPPKYSNKEDILKIKDSAERQKAIAEHIELFKRS